MCIDVKRIRHFVGLSVICSLVAINCQASVLPAAPIDEFGNLIGETEYRIEKIQVVGNSVLSRKELNLILSRYEGRSLGLSELEQLRLEISRIYYTKGYINTGAVLPDQDFNEGVATINIIEGTLSEVEIRGTGAVRTSAIERDIQRGLGAPININDLQYELKKLKRRYPIESVKAQLNPLSNLGEAELQLDVHERTSQFLTLSLNNYRSPSVGGEQVVLSYFDDSLFGVGDDLYLGVSDSEGIEGDIYISYETPITPWETKLALSYSDSNSFVVEAPFDTLDVESVAEYRSLGIRQSVFQSNKNIVEVLVSYAENHSESYLLGERFSFSSGTINGEADTRVASLGAEWIHRGKSFVVASRITMKQGLDQSGATIHEGDFPDGEFTAINAQIHFVQRFSSLSNSNLQIKLTIQETSDPLLAIEKFGVGGRYSVRGYRENTFVRDKGIVGNIEFHYPLDINLLSDSASFIAFYDWGESTDNSFVVSGTSLNVDGRSDSISSIGLGLNWQPVSWAEIEFYWANALTEVEFPEEDELQDNGFHIAANFTLPLD